MTSDSMSRAALLPPASCGTITYTSRSVVLERRWPAGEAEGGAWRWEPPHGALRLRDSNLDRAGRCAAVPHTGIAP
jgi:hypothetical protein